MPTMVYQMGHLLTYSIVIQVQLTVVRSVYAVLHFNGDMCAPCNEWTEMSNPTHSQQRFIF